jgi:uncharacterized membrane protein YbhN (UPF0104 family)
VNPIAKTQTVQLNSLHLLGSWAKKASQSGGWKRLVRCVGVVLTIVSVIGYSYTLIGHFDVLASLELTRFSLAATAFGIVLYPAIYGLAAGIWIYSLRCLGASLPWRASAEIGFTAQFGKYLPGNVAHHVARVVFAKRYNVTTKLVLGSMVIETLCLVGCGGLIALLALLGEAELRMQIFDLLPSKRWPYWLVAALLTCLSTGAFLVCQKGLLKTLPFKPQWLIHGSILTVFVFVLHGLIAQAVLVGVFQVSAPLATVTGVFALAWVVGFLTPGAPAGIGVREVVLTLGLGTICPPGVAVGLAAVLRLVSTCGDGLTYLIGRWLCGGRR